MVNFREAIEHSGKPAKDMKVDVYFISAKREKIKSTILNKDGKFELVKGEDETKDQSYVLFNLNQKIMKKLKLPIGIYSKIKIREIASEFELINADKPDSQDICFIPDRDYKKYINKKVKNTEGNIVDSSGNVLGEHAGIHNFTIGQRKGLGIETSGKPIFELFVLNREQKH